MDSEEFLYKIVKKQIIKHDDIELAYDFMNFYCSHHNEDLQITIVNKESE